MTLRILATLVPLACGTLVVGCAPATNYYSDASVKSLAPEETAQLVVNFTGQVHVLKIDGNPAGDPGGLAKEHRYWLRPGIHNLVVFYNDGNRHSVHNAEVTFVLEPGHRYEMHGWPPKVVDKTAGHGIEARLRVADE